MRRLPLLILVLPAGLGVGAFAMEALDTSAGQRGLRLAITPKRQAVAPGQTAPFSVTVARGGGPAALRVSGLRRGVKAALRLSNGRRVRALPDGHDKAILTLTASRRARPGRMAVTVEARSRGRTRRRTIRLRVVPSARRLVKLAARPANAAVLPGETASYRVEAERRGRRALPVRVRGLPRGVRASWSSRVLLRDRALLRLQVHRDAPPGAHHLLVYAPGRQPRRDAVLVLNVVEGHDFGIRGDLGPPLYPGRSEPLELTFTNPNDFPIVVTHLSVAVAGTSNPGCAGSNYVVSEYSGPYPLRLPPGDTALGEVVRDRALWPRVAMLNLPTSQDACKAARVSLQYRGAARR